MTPNNDKGPLTDEQKKQQLRDLLTEVVRITAELSTGSAGEFGVSMGPDVPDLRTARESSEVRTALATLDKAEQELGLVNVTLAFAESIARALGFALP